MIILLKLLNVNTRTLTPLNPEGSIAWTQSIFAVPKIISEILILIVDNINYLLAPIEGS